MKKNIKITLSFILFLGINFFGNTQNNITTVPVSSINSCDGSATLVDSNYYSSWTWYDQSQTILQQGGGNVYGLCYGTYSIVYVDSMGGNNTSTFLIDTLSVNPCGNFYISVDSIVQLSGTGACDGVAIVSAHGGDGNYTYFWASGSTANQISGACAGIYQVDAYDGNGCSATTYVQIFVDSTTNCSGFISTVSQSTQVSGPNTCDGSASLFTTGGSGSYTYTWDNGATTQTNNALCSGYHTVTVYDNQTGCSETLTIYIYQDSTQFNALGGYVYSSNPSVDGACDGSAYIDVWGGTAPYTFLNSDGSTTQSLNNLCAGIYSSTVYDANGDSLNLNFIIADPGNIFNGGNYPDSTIIDTLGASAAIDCIIDYLTLDTAFVSNVQYISNDSILVTWSVIDANGTITVTQSYTISTGAGVYELILQIFCPQRADSKYLYARDQIYFDPSLANIFEAKKSVHFDVYPNPVENNLNIALDDINQTLIVIMDISGKIIFTERYTGKNIQINTSNFSKGQYLLTISNDKINTVTRFIK